MWVGTGAYPYWEILRYAQDDMYFIENPHNFGDFARNI